MACRWTGGDGHFFNRVFFLAGQVQIPRRFFTTPRSVQNESFCLTQDGAVILTPKRRGKDLLGSSTSSTRKRLTGKHPIEE